MRNVTLEVSGNTIYIEMKLTHGGAEWSITQPFSGAGDLIAKFCAEFERLRKNFDSGVDIGAALLLSRTAATIDVIRACRPLTFRSACVCS